MAGDTGSALGALILGVIQGLTEFLPVSSSGHLVLFQQWIPVSGDHLLFDLVLHVGTLIPVLYYYREWVLKLVMDPFVGEGPVLEREGVRWLGLIVLASVPTAIIGLTFEDLFETLFSTPATLAVSFTCTALLLLATSRFDRSHLASPLSPAIVLALGVAQGFAITPGISRSGATIAVALLLGLERETAARFSFLMSVPAILGGLLLQLRKAELGAVDPVQLTVGGLASLVTGYLALVLLVQVVRAGRMAWFAGYLFAVALFALYLAVSA